MADWDNVTDVSSLKAMLAAQQAQLQHLQSKETVDDLHAKSSNRKRKTVAVHQGEYDTSSFSDEEHATAADSADYNPEDDSDYDAPKKTSSSKKKKVSSSGKAKKGRRAADRDTDSEDDAPAANSAQVAKAAAAALRSIKSTINAQMVYNPSIKYGSSRVSLELPCLSLAVISQMLGPNMIAKASNGKKQLQLKASTDDVDEMFSSKWGGVFSKSLRYGAILGLAEGLTFTHNKGTETQSAWHVQDVQVDSHNCTTCYCYSYYHYDQLTLQDLSQ